MITEHSCGIIPFFSSPNGYRFLIVRHHEGHRGFPKGHAEKNEKPQETALREFQEETGVHDITVYAESPFHQEYTFPHAQKGIIHKHVRYFFGELPENVSKNIHIQESEIQEYFIGSFQEIWEKLTDPRKDRSGTMPPLLREIEKRLQQRK